MCAVNRVEVIRSADRNGLSTFSKRSLFLIYNLPLAQNSLTCHTL
jgi:hypothetical protein